MPNIENVGPNAGSMERKPREWVVNGVTRIWMTRPGEPCPIEVEYTPESLHPKMAEGWMQCDPPD